MTKNEFLQGLKEELEGRVTQFSHSGKYPIL